MVVISSLSEQTPCRDSNEGHPGRGRRDSTMERNRHGPERLRDEIGSELIGMDVFGAAENPVYGEPWVAHASDIRGEICRLRHQVGQLVGGGGPQCFPIRVAQGWRHHLTQREWALSACD